ncbi:hypothetical protein BTVI_147459 [Pitangus sulphuratus]|nr:hypothetical protein BTVI_147459 [Pitangus sulphuratus]
MGPVQDPSPSRVATRSQEFQLSYLFGFKLVANGFSFSRVSHDAFDYKEILPFHQGEADCFKSCDKAREKCLAYTSELSKANILDYCGGHNKGLKGGSSLDNIKFRRDEGLHGTFIMSASGVGPDIMTNLTGHDLGLISHRRDAKKLLWHQVDGLLPSSRGPEPVEQHKMVLGDSREEVADKPAAAEKPGFDPSCRLDLSVESVNRVQESPPEPDPIFPP